MRLKSYKYSEKGSWSFPEVTFGRLNLIVGDSGTGKTRFLNTLFNLGRLVVGSGSPAPGSWRVELEEDATTYTWTLEIRRESYGGQEKPCVVAERLWEEKQGGKRVILKRDGQDFRLGDNVLPKLSRDAVSVKLLSEEPPFDSIHRLFATIMRRQFSEGDVTQAAQHEGVSPHLSKRKFRNLRDLFYFNPSLSLKLHFLSSQFPEIFDTVARAFREVFPFVTEVAIKDLQTIHEDLSLPVFAPTLCIRERHIKSWLPLPELSSGMKKVLLILADICTLPDGGIYLIDEYENSLGVGAIDFLPPFLIEQNKDAQYILTSHHPYIINQIPARHWCIFHRKGATVKVLQGPQNEDRFGKSRQQRFIQLINDSFYVEGVE